jgi:serine/threonine-protein kinase
MTPLTLAPGDRFGAYEVVELVGAGGMGEVYRARDMRLPRDVALKVLPDHRRMDPQRRAHFEREAQLLSSLNHPNIATLYGIAESGDSTALVMELVEGDTVADLLSSGGGRSTTRSGDRRGQPLSVRGALEIGRQLAEALESAHERGIIHRDLKPANIKVRPDGTVKVLDFGLAKIDAADIPGDTTAATLTASGPVGVVVGTAAYMSPEQARGLEVDRRTDIWAFGCVLYELLTGRRAFTGDTTSDALASILTMEPDFAALPASVPSSMESLLRRCLAKDARDRLRHIGDARIEIVEALAAPVAQRQRRVASGRRWQLAGALALIGGLSAAVGWLAGRPASESSDPVTQVPLALPEAPIIPERPVPVQLSDDGSRILYFSVLGMAGASTSDGGVVVINRGNDASAMALSPDGESVAFFEAGTLKKAPVNGGRTTTLASGLGASPTARWTREGFILVATQRGLFRVPDEPGGELKQIPVRLEATEGIYYPVLLPDGRHAIATISEGGLVPFNAATSADAVVEVINLDSGARKVLINGGFAHYLSSGHLVYWARGALQARTFDLRSLEPGRDEVQVVDNVAHFSVSGNGTLVYVTGVQGAAASELVWANRGNAEEQSLGIDPMRVVYPRLSPSGRYVAMIGIARENRDVFLWDIETRQRFDVTNDAHDDQTVGWASDDRLLFSSRRFGPANMFIQAIDGSGVSGEPQRLVVSPNVDQFPGGFDAAGRLLFGERSATGNLGVFQLDLTTRRVESLLNTDAIETSATLSPPPKNEWLAFQSDKSGQFEVYVQTYPVAGSVTPVSRGGGTQPVFSRDGTELFYRDFFGAVWAVPVPAFNSRTRILDARDYYGKGALLQARTYDVAKDGRFLMIKNPRQDLFLVVNWVERLKKLLPAP